MPRDGWQTYPMMTSSGSTKLLASTPSIARQPCATLYRHFVTMKTRRAWIKPRRTIRASISRMTWIEVPAGVPDAARCGTGALLRRFAMRKIGEEASHQFVISAGRSKSQARSFLPAHECAGVSWWHAIPKTYRRKRRAYPFCFNSRKG